MLQVLKNSETSLCAVDMLSELYELYELNN